MTEVGKEVTVIGEKVEFEDGRVVSVGVGEGTDVFFFSFLSKEGEKLDFQTSKEAARTVCALLLKHFSVGRIA